MNGKMTMTVGVLIRPGIRRALKDLAFERDDFVFEENKKFLESDFTMRGPELLLTSIKTLLEDEFGT